MHIFQLYVFRNARLCLTQWPLQVLLCRCHVQLHQNIQTDISSQIIVDVLIAVKYKVDLKHRQWTQMTFEENTYSKKPQICYCWLLTTIWNPVWFCKDGNMWVSVLYLTLTALLCWSTAFASSLLYFEEDVNHMMFEMWFVPQEITQWKSYFKIFFNTKLTAPLTVSQISAWPAPSAHPPHL